MRQPIGGVAEYASGPLAMHARATVALAGREEVIGINGNTRILGPAGQTLAVGPRSLLAEPSNSGLPHPAFGLHETTLCAQEGIDLSLEFRY
jgi:hypothetical protein